MSEREDDLRGAVESLVRQFAHTVVRDGVPCYWTGGLSALEYAFEVLGWDDPHPCPENQCQAGQPGCEGFATCGTPTPNGYQRVCGECFFKINPRPEPPKPAGEGETRA